MIVQSDIVDILYLKCQQFGLPVYRKGNIPESANTQERIVIIPKRGTTETYWSKSYVEVNFCVPDINEGVAELKRLAELEKAAKRALNESGIYDNTRYEYTVDSTGIEEDAGLKCHFANIRVLFKVLNVKSN